jgi:hypothetical protein
VPLPIKWLCPIEVVTLASNGRTRRNVPVPADLFAERLPWKAGAIHVQRRIILAFLRSLQRRPAKRRQLGGVFVTHVASKSVRKIQSSFADSLAEGSAFAMIMYQ